MPTHSNLPPQQLDTLQESLRTIRAALSQNRQQRQLVVLAGPEAWGQSLAQALLNTDTLKPGIWVGDAPVTQRCKEGDETSGHAAEVTLISNQDYRQYLGQSYHHLVYNAWSGLRANALAALSGTLSLPGVMLILCPPLDAWPQYSDPEKPTRISHGFLPEASRSPFVEHLVQSIESDPQVKVITPDNLNSIDLNVLSGKAETSIVSASAVNSSLTTQNDAIQAIVALLESKRKGQMLVLSADRGRGKSSALGLAAAKLPQHINVVITAPHPRHVHQAQHHYWQQTEQKLTFQPMDQLLLNPQNVQLLLVDEAAAIPVQSLIKLTQHYRAIVFSTTIHGYEGSGRGFELRFKPYLQQHFPHYQQRHLTKPMRWHTGDPLEAFWFKSLLLQEQNSCLGGPQWQQIQCYTGAELQQNPPLLGQLFSLLVNAHYQTTPDDLVALLDGPDNRVFVATNAQQTPVAAAWLSLEGGEKLAAISEAIVHGQRRPGGHLLAQRLAVYQADQHFCHYRYGRIVRIAVQPQWQQQGVGLQLLAHIKTWAKEQQLDALGTSFGASAALVDFWHKAEFAPIRLGYRIDPATAEPNLMMLNPISGALTSQLAALQQSGRDDLLHHISQTFKHCDSRLLLRLLRYFPAWPLTADETRQLRLFSEGKRPLDLSLRSISRILTSGVKWHRLSIQQQILLLQFALQQIPIQEIRDPDSSGKPLVTGKKQLAQVLRDAVTQVFS